MMPGNIALLAILGVSALLCCLQFWQPSNPTVCPKYYTIFEMAARERCITGHGRIG
jgi:hypothetical protein